MCLFSFRGTDREEWVLLVGCGLDVPWIPRQACPSCSLCPPIDLLASDARGHLSPDFVSLVTPVARDTVLCSFEGASRFSFVSWRWRFCISSLAGPQSVCFIISIIPSFQHSPTTSSSKFIDMKLGFLLLLLGLAAAVPSNFGLHRRQSDEADSTAASSAEASSTPASSAGATSATPGSGATSATPDSGAPGAGAAVTANRRLLVGAKGTIYAVDFDGQKFEIVAFYSDTENEDANFSWLAFKPPNLVYAVDEDSKDFYLIRYDRDAEKKEQFKKLDKQQGIEGLVHLAMNKDQTLMIGSSYSKGETWLWDIGAENKVESLGPMKKDLPSDLLPESGQENVLKPHQAVLDPKKKFFVVNYLGADTVAVFDAQTREPGYMKHIHTTEGCGPRHGQFYVPKGSEHTTYYYLVCETSRQLLTYKVTYQKGAPGDTLYFEPLQSLQTFTRFPRGVDSNAAEISMVENHIYISNRATKYPEDSIAHFVVMEDGHVSFDGESSSMAVGPRMMSLSLDNRFLFVANTEDGKGVKAIERFSNGSLPYSHDNTDTNVELGVAPIVAKFVLEWPGEDNWPETNAEQGEGEEETSKVSPANAEPTVAPSTGAGHVRREELPGAPGEETTKGTGAKRTTALEAAVLKESKEPVDSELDEPDDPEEPERPERPENAGEIQGGPGSSASGHSESAGGTGGSPRITDDIPWMGSPNNGGRGRGSGWRGAEVVGG